MPLVRQTFHVPFTQGIDTKPDPRIIRLPALEKCDNGVLSTPGAIIKRKPVQSLSALDINGVAVPADHRRLAVYGDELLLFTKEKLFSWSEEKSRWVDRGEHLATKVTEKAVFTQAEEQISADRAELSGVVFIAWHEPNNGVFVGALDKTTGAVIQNTYQIASGTTADRPRLVALTNRVLLFYRNTLGDLHVWVLNPANIKDSLDNPIDTQIEAAGASFNVYYDVTKGTGTEAYVVRRRDPTTDYRISKVNESGVVSGTTTVARRCDGPIALAVEPNTGRVAVFRFRTSPSTDLMGDILSSTFADISGAVDKVIDVMQTGEAADNPAQLACAFRSVTDAGNYRCYVFYCDPGPPSTLGSADFVTQYNYLDSAGNVGSVATAARRLAPASRAFDHAGKIYVWLAFAADSSVSGGMTKPVTFALQNSYFLVRDDGELISVACKRIAGGFASKVSCLPEVQKVGSTYYWCGLVREKILLGQDQRGYSGRSPQEISWLPDSNEARRTTHLGNTLYITGGQVLQFDGESLSEVNFHVFPFYHSALFFTESGGVVEVGLYTYRCTAEWRNARQELDRSTTAASSTADSNVGGFPRGSLTISPLPLYKKAGLVGLVIWRTLKNPALDAALYRTSSVDPTVTTGDNRYIANVKTDNAVTPGYKDNFTDATLDDKELYHENAGVLENLSPPAATIIASNAERVFLAGIAHNPYQVWYSKIKEPGLVASFHDGNTVEIRSQLGPITALGFLSEILVVFTKRAIVLLPGIGFDNTGFGSNYGPPRELSLDIGCTSADLLTVTPGGLMFFSEKGWYLLDSQLQLRYIGGPVEKFNSDAFSAIVTLEKEHQVRITQTGLRTLVYHYDVDQWAVWDGDMANEHAVVYKGTYYMIKDDLSGVTKQRTDYTSNLHSLVVETPWIPLADIAGFQSIRRLQILGEFRSAHDLKVELFRDYNASTVFQTETWTATPTVTGGPERLTIKLAIRKMAALKVRITDKAVGTANPPALEGVRLNSISLDLALKGGLGKLPDAQVT